MSITNSSSSFIQLWNKDILFGLLIILIALSQSFNDKERPDASCAIIEIELRTTDVKDNGNKEPVDLELAL